MSIELLQAIRERRSVREFTTDPVSQIDVNTILEAGTWAPSVRNCQPWRFVLIEEPGVRAIVSDCTVYSSIIAHCPVLIGIYLDTGCTGNSDLDQQSVGAVVQNMLLAAESLGLGAVWIGEVQESRGKINMELGIAQRYQLAALLAIGYPAHRNQRSHRKHVNDFILKTIGG